MVGRVTIFSHWENWWKVKAVEGRGVRTGSPVQPLPPGTQLALTGSRVDGALLPVDLQAKVVHGAVGQQPVDGQFQQQGQQGQQGLGPGCRARQSWPAGNRAEGGQPGGWGARAEASGDCWGKETWVRMAGCWDR